MDVWKSESVTHFLRTDFLQPIHFFTASSLEAPNTCACSMCKQCAFRHITRVPLCLSWTHNFISFQWHILENFLTSVLWAELAVRYCKGQLAPESSQISGDVRPTRARWAVPQCHSSSGILLANAPAVRYYCHPWPGRRDSGFQDMLLPVEVAAPSWKAICQWGRWKL